MRWVCCIVGYFNTIFLFRLRHLESFDQMELDTFARLFRIRKGPLNIQIRNHHRVHATGVFMQYHISADHLLPFSENLVFNGNQEAFTLRAGSGAGINLYHDVPGVAFQLHADTFIRLHTGSIDQFFERRESVLV